MRYFASKEACSVKRASIQFQETVHFNGYLSVLSAASAMHNDREQISLGVRKRPQKGFVSLLKFSDFLVGSDGAESADAAYGGLVFPINSSELRIQLINACSAATS